MKTSTLHMSSVRSLTCQNVKVFLHIFTVKKQTTWPLQYGKLLFPNHSTCETWMNKQLPWKCMNINMSISSKKARKKEVPCFTQKFSSNSQKLTKLSPWMSSHTNKNLPWITYKNKHCFHQFCLTARHYSNVSCRENPLLHCLCTRGGHKSYKAQNVDTYKQTNKTHYILQYTAGSLPPQGHNWLTSRFLFFFFHLLVDQYYLFFCWVNK